MDPRDYSANDLGNYVKKLFQLADVNGDGVLTPIEFADLLVRSGFNFPAHVVLAMLSDADTNHDGSIQYEEFLPAMLNLALAAANGQLPPPPPAGNPEDAVRQWFEVPVEQLITYFNRLFQISDFNGDGVLQPLEFLDLLQRSGLNFPPDIILNLFIAADTNHDGVIEYDEFIPAMKAIIAGMKDGAAKNAAGAMPDISDVPPAMLKRYLKKLFSVADVNGDGVLQPDEFKRLLELSGFNFTPQQIRQLMARADVNHDGVIEYEEFVPVAMAVLKAGQSGRSSSPPKPRAAAPQTRPQPAQTGRRSSPPKARAVDPPRPAVSRASPSASRSPGVSSDVADLEGRVLAVQSRRLIRSKIKDLFALLDRDQDGRLSASELASAFGDGVARRIVLSMDRNMDSLVSQYEMRRFFDDETAKAVESGVAEHTYLEGVVEMLEASM